MIGLAAERRVKRFVCDNGLLVHLLQKGYPQNAVCEDIPEDARIVASEHDGFLRRTIFLLESDTFEPVRGGEQIPLLVPVIRLKD